MQVVYHLGANSTDEERLVRGLLRANGPLAAQGVIVPGPGRYRPVLRETMIKLKGGPASRDVQEVLLDAVVDADHVDRLVFSNEYFLCIPQRVISEGAFYPMAARKVAAMANLFPDDMCEFHMALRNPATLIPALLARVKGASYEEFMGSADPRQIRWLPVVQRILAAVPGRTLTLWCNEDTPLIWPEVLRSVAGVGPDFALDADTDVLATIMTEDGMKRLQTYLASHPPATIDQRRKIVSAFLSKFAKPEELEVEVALPGWTEAMIDEITEAYDRDVAEIAVLPGVRFIAP
ncbi:hypothetical protein [Frigidibacter mobilis]|uniref:Uncharacterized protein n=1 Tax=Frigidibacter mobilis TaxID=1335048 RepID=A0A159Z5I2_9RHOB|nr:hypothetical protein [Frigidibacter mobilis]AMY69670.1 hypothetical protein AKL17_2425 [Frigidibacter mobilis]